MNSSNQPDPYRLSAQQDRSAVNAAFMSRVYFWMMMGLLLSGLVAYGVAGSQEMLTLILTNKVLWIGIIILQFVAVIALSAMVNRLTAFAMTTLYLAYAMLSGVTFSVILLAFTAESVYQAFFITAFSFVGLSAFGYLTKRDLGPIGSFCMTGLFGIIGLMLVGFIFPSIMTNAVQMTINVCGIIIFAGLTAYDTQKIKSLNVSNGNDELAKKLAIRGALTLYLDFVNLFISILRLTGNRK